MSNPSFPKIVIDLLVLPSLLLITNFVKHPTSRKIINQIRAKFNSKYSIFNVTKSVPRFSDVTLKIGSYQTIKSRENLSWEISSHQLDINFNFLAYVCKLFGIC